MIPKGKSYRSKTLYNNILGSGVFKGLNVVINLLVIRYAILLVGEEQFGIWLALLSFLTWFSAFEVGVSNSLRNKITALFSKDKFENIKQLIATGYKSLVVVYVLVFGVLLLVINLLPVENLLLPTNYTSNNFGILIQVCCGLYFSLYVAFFVHSLLLATHKTKFTYLVTAIQNGILLLGLLYGYYFHFTPSLFLFCIWFTAIPLLVWSIASVFSYKFFFRKIQVTLKEVSSASLLKAGSLGRGFFLIQVCTLIIYSTDSIILVNLLSGEDVTLYNVTFKYFNILIVIFNLILLPYWASFTDAYFKKDKGWITTHIQRLVLVWLSTIILGILMHIISSWAFQLWIGKEMNVDPNLSTFMFISILLTMWNSIFSSFLNGISKVKLQQNLLLFAAIINIPLSIYLVQKLGASGAIIATCVSLFPLAILLPLQYKKAVNQMEIRS